MARQLGWSQAKVSRVERGVTLAKPAEVEAWTGLLHAGPELRERLVELAERQGAELTRYKRATAPGRRRRQEEIRTLEAAAGVIWVFAPNDVPGLAQTGRYAEAMFRIGRNRAISDQEVAVAVEARLARQGVLNDESKQFNLLFTETTLHRSLLPKADMQTQLRRLMELARLNNIRMGVIPFSVRERTHVYHGFSILGDPDVDDGALVIAETVTRRLTIRAPDEVREYIAHYERLAESALFGDNLLRLLQEISEEAPWS